VDRLLSSPDLPRLAVLMLIIAAVNAAGLLLFAVDVRLPFAFLIAVVGTIVALESPLLGIALVLAGRVTSTGANAWIRIGSLNLDLFEPSVMLVLTAIVLRMASRKTFIWPDAPWRLPMLVFLGFQFVSIVWSVNKTEGISEIVATLILLATTFAILTIVKTYDHLRYMSYAWIGASVLVGLASVLGVTTPSESATFEMASGNRAGGFGQHPNWFSMNLMYGVMLAAAYTLVERKLNMRLIMAATAMFLFLAQMMSGSRGGSGAIIIGSGIAAMFHPVLRAQVFKFAVVGAVAVVGIILTDDGSTAAAFSRIWVDSATADSQLGAGVREQNWLVCVEMFKDTWGRGIGAGGYETLLPFYNYWISNSDYTYPHGIFWGILAHYGVVGLVLMFWVVVVIVRMTVQMVRWLQGKPEQMLVLAMFGTMIGYFSWSFFEFLYDEKPFWEFLGLYTVLWTIARNEAQAAEAAAAPPPKAALEVPETTDRIDEPPVGPDDDTGRRAWSGAGS
jgi:O-antigen ligase